MSFTLCAPAIIYLFFSITQIIIDTYTGMYNTAFVKTIVTLLITLLLNIMCERGLTIISWFIVFIPFIFMTVIVGILLYAFGLDVATGKIKQANNSNNSNNSNTNPNPNNLKMT